MMCRWPTMAMMLTGLASLAGGCAQRTLTIRSEPSGAVVWLNDLEIGRTPVTVDFTDYGNYDVVLRHERCETLKTSRRLSPPLHMIPPVDLLSELCPCRASDRQEWTFTLTTPSTRPVDPGELVARGEALRTQLRSSEFTTRPSTRHWAQPSTRPDPQR